MNNDRSLWPQLPNSDNYFFTIMIEGTAKSVEVPLKGLIMSVTRRVSDHITGDPNREVATYSNLDDCRPTVSLKIRHITLVPCDSSYVHSVHKD
jgi:hypothetical protein